ncbi:MAG: F0F1 ATP synthase subunit A [Candidatus Karelsulcia muelleri]
MNFFLFLIFLFGFSNLRFLHSQKLNNKKNFLFNPAFFILNHIKDSHEWNFFEKEKKNVSFSLPILILNKGLRLNVFMSSKFNHGNNLLKINKFYYRFFHDKIYQTNSVGFLKTDKNGLILNKIPFDFSITKNVFCLITSLFILSFIFIKFSSSYKKKFVKNKLFILLEAIIFFLKNEIVIPNLGKKKDTFYLPLLLTLFFYILVNNILGIIPTGPNITGNISVTLSLSMIIFLITFFSSKKNYWKHLFFPPNVPFLIKFLLIPIEILGLLIRPFTLCIRLFANITAGHIILLSFISLIFLFQNFVSIVISIPFSIFISLLEIMVCFLQAFIFTSLSALYLGLAIN